MPVQNLFYSTQNERLLFVPDVCTIFSCVTYNTDSVRQGVREYIALGPEDIGRLGCFWMTDEMLGLLDSLLMVRTFRIAQPTDYGIPLIQPLQYNNDEDAFFRTPI